MDYLTQEYRETREYCMYSVFANKKLIVRWGQSAPICITNLIREAS